MIFYKYIFFPVLVKIINIKFQTLNKIEQFVIISYRYFNFLFFVFSINANASQYDSNKYVYRWSSIDIILQELPFNGDYVECQDCLLFDQPDKKNQ